MINIEGNDNKDMVSKEPAAEKKPVSVRVPADNEVGRAAKRVLHNKANINVIEKHNLEKPHFAVMGGSLAAMAVLLLISGIVKGNRQKVIDGLSYDINKLNNQLTIQTSSGTYHDEARNARAQVGLDDAQLSHDSELIRSHLSGLLTWNIGERENHWESARANYNLNGSNNNVATAFFAGSFEASTFNDVTVYCTGTNAGARTYACAVDWTTVDSYGEEAQQSGILTCTVSGSGADEKLMNLDAYRNSSMTVTGSAGTSAERDPVTGDIIETDGETLDEADETNNVDGETLGGIRVGGEEFQENGGYIDDEQADGNQQPSDTEIMTLEIEE